MLHHNEKQVGKRVYPTESGTVEYTYFEEHTEKRYYNEDGEKGYYFYVKRKGDKEWVRYENGL